MNDLGQMNVKTENADDIAILSTPELCTKCAQILYTGLGMRLHHGAHNLAASVVKFKKVQWLSVEFNFLLN